MCFFMCFTFCLAFMPCFLCTFRLCTAIRSGLFRCCSAFVLPPFRRSRCSSSFSLKSVRPEATLASRAAFVRCFAGAPFSASAETAPCRRPESPRSSSEASSPESPAPESWEAEVEEAEAEAARRRPSCSSTDRCSRTFRRRRKSSLLRTCSVSNPLAGATVAPVAAAAPSPPSPPSEHPSSRLRRLASTSRPSIPSAAWSAPYWGARTSPRLSAMAASRPRRDRCSNCGCNSRYALMRLRAATDTPLCLNLRNSTRSPSSSSVRMFTDRKHTSRMLLRPTSMTSGACASVTKFRITCRITGRNSSGGTCACDASTRQAKTLVTSCCVGSK
mmetsp:Transcript_91145/g.253781  ORF Transcript_91145/g.253781 Transcript_91145/m.253781 type:complete len:331 (+) Transcript_91145:290-1282(+)